jgi:manganese oxidase
MNRRNFFNSAALTAVAAASVSKVAMAALPEPVIQTPRHLWCSKQVSPTTP